MTDHFLFFVNRVVVHALAVVVVCGGLSIPASSHADDFDDTWMLPYHQAASSSDGNAQRGETLFKTHPTLQCSQCHNIVGMEKNGPNLDGVGEKYTREQLVRQILFPSESIVPGFEQAQLLTDDGKVLVGRIERSTKDFHRLINAQGKSKDIRADTVESLDVSPVSMMPSDLVKSISPSDFADLIAYLRSLKFGVKEGLVSGGTPIAIPRLETPVTFVPLLDENLAFENPVWCGVLPGTSDLLVAEHQTAKLWRLEKSGGSFKKHLYVDLAAETFYSANQGLMCVAFHPDFVSNRRYFLKHEIKEDGQVKSTVVERMAREDGRKDAGIPSKRLLEQHQPAFNHNGGCIEFGPDGFLYVGFGDGGPQKDPPGFSQNPGIFHGSILRIDVDQASDEQNYGIPPDNPFFNAKTSTLESAPETWAIGFREPWRFSFDKTTGELYVGDVGQNKFEEICLVRAGENHGWNVKEGFEEFSGEYFRDEARYTDPLFAYPHGLGFSVTGGHVYYGNAAPSYRGVYIFGDYNTRRVWGLRQTNGKVDSVVEIGTAPGGIASFGVDADGELLLVTYAGGLYQIDLTKSPFPAYAAEQN